MNYIPTFIFYGDRASGKSHLANILSSHEALTVSVFDDLSPTKAQYNKLKEKIDYELHNYQVDMFVIITWAEGRDLKELIAILKEFKNLLITTCEFKKN